MIQRVKKNKPSFNGRFHALPPLQPRCASSDTAQVKKAEEDAQILEDEEKKQNGDGEGPVGLKTEPVSQEQSKPPTTLEADD